MREINPNTVMRKLNVIEGFEQWLVSSLNRVNCTIDCSLDIDLYIDSDTDSDAT